jgi:DNA-binding Xre family transcriptional regulator
MKMNDVEKKILALDRSLEERNIVLVPDLNQIQVFKENPKSLQEYIPYIQSNIDFTSDLAGTLKKFLYSPFLFITELIRKINFIKKTSENVIEVDSNSNILAPTSVKAVKSNDEIFSSILTMVEDHADTETFAQRVKKLSFQKYKTTKEFSESANIDYSHLNKLINGKLRENAVISRDLAIKICLALELDLLDSNELLSLAGYILCGNTSRDRMLSLCIMHKTGVTQANIILEKRGLPILK